MVIYLEEVERPISLMKKMIRKPLKRMKGEKTIRNKKRRSSSTQFSEMDYSDIIK